MFSRDPWWGLSGPAGFVSALSDDLRLGRNIIVALPEHHPPGLIAALADRLLDESAFGLRELELDGLPPEKLRSPARLIHDRFAPLTDPITPASARTVAVAPALSGTVIWVSGLSREFRADWWRFLDQYKEACRLRPEYDRCLLAVPWVGTPPTDIPRDDLTLAIHHWKGVVRRFDMLVYLSRRFERSSVPLAFRDLAVAMAVEIAGTDPELGDHLANASLDQIIEPFDLLHELARKRGWSAECVEPHAWHRGTLDRRDGRMFPHSAAEVAAGKTTTIARRIWHGQVAVLYPLLEDLRLRFVDQFRQLLTIPYRTEYDTIREPEGLELAHLHQQLRPQLPARRLVPLERCKFARNELAHLRPLPADILLDPDFAALLERN
jgi:hypothetical protein